MDQQPHRVYANAVAAHGGAFDVALDFGYGVDEETPETLVRVAMSWEHASVVVKILNGLIERYEEQLGALPDMEKARADAAGSTGAAE